MEYSSTLLTSRPSIRYHWYHGTRYWYQIPWYFTHPTRDMGEQLLAVPCCGLGNRISLLLGAIAVAKNASLNLTVAWRTDPVLVRTAPKQQQSPASRTLLLSLTCVLPRASECTLRRAVRAVVHRRRRQRQRPRFAVGRRQPKTLRSASCRGSAANDRAGEDQLPIRSAQA